MDHSIRLPSDPILWGKAQALNEKTVAGVGFLVFFLVVAGSIVIRLRIEASAPHKVDVTAWIMRGGREQRDFEEFFASWRSRYDQLERDRDDRLNQGNRLQKDLDAANERLATQGNRPELETAATETSRYR